MLGLQRAGGEGKDEEEPNFDEISSAMRSLC